MTTAAWTVLLEFDPVGIVLLVLARRVGPLLALGAGELDRGTRFDLRHVALLDDADDGAGTDGPATLADGEALADLEREHDAGDLDDGDYQTLKDGYTQRAAVVLRAIDEGRRAQPPRPARRWSRTLLAAGSVAVLAVALGVAVSRFAGQRLPGETVSGGMETRMLVPPDARSAELDTPE